jgi:hypothetical protein
LVLGPAPYECLNRIQKIHAEDVDEKVEAIPSGATAEVLEVVTLD